MEKNIVLEDGNIVKFNNEERRILIDKGYLQNGELSKVLTMFMGDDIGFEAFPFSDEDIDSIDFQIPLYDPLYKHFKSLLGTDDSLIIDDDMTVEEKRKYIKIHRDKQGILINFYNDLEDDLITNKFNITIINIMRDGRSKIDRDGLDTKERLVKFFKDIEKEILFFKDKEEKER